MIAHSAEPVIWSFDLGKGSIGEAVRQGTNFLHVASWLIPQDLAQRGPAAQSGTPASRYRAWRTRVAHRAREDRLVAICQECGIETLKAKRTTRDPSNHKSWIVVHEADDRLTREFPAPGDNTCFNSALLRVQLLRGLKLEGWQIFKALHSAIQRRGYDERVSWAAERSDKSSADEDGVTRQRVDTYRTSLEQMAPGQPEFHLPCFLEANRLGLWSPENPDVYRLRIDHEVAPVRNREAPGNPDAIIAPRELVIAETRALLIAAARQFPMLDGRSEEILFGRGQKAYASYDPALCRQLGLRRGGAADWDGILGQKVPRFDNRIIAKCAVITRLNTCKTDIRYFTNSEGVKNPVPSSLLAAEVTFLLKLKNARVQRPDRSIHSLSAVEIRSLFEDPKRTPTKLNYTAREWTNKLQAFGYLPVPGSDQIEAPRATGRSRFCRPALEIIKSLVLSGETPAAARDRELRDRVKGNTDQQKGLVADDLDFLLPSRMGDTWELLHVPDQHHETLVRLATSVSPAVAIRKLIGGVNNPVVRHRLDAFWKRLRDLETQTGSRPDEIVLEFVRTDFMGPKARQQLEKFQSERRAARAAAQKEASTVSQRRSSALKLELLKAQGGICLYSGQSLPATDVDNLEIEHIVPRANGGPDAQVNYVVTTQAVNNAKGDRTPYEWFAANSFNNGYMDWDGYTHLVKARATNLRAKKVRLLTESDAAEQVQRYTALAETAYIARLSQTLAALHFGWPVHSQEGARRITVISGGLTARVRRKYRLNSILNPCPPDEDPKDWEENADVAKNRTDKRHHALDAMVISFLPGWARDPRKERFFGLPEGVTPESFRSKLEQLSARQLHFDRTALEATAYGRRTINLQQFGVSRTLLRNVPVRVGQGNKRTLKVSPSGKDEAAQIVDPVIRHEVQAFLDANRTNLTLEAWDEWCRMYRRGGINGPLAKKVLVTITKPDALHEYADLSKDGTGQLRKGKRHRGYFVIREPNPSRSDPTRSRTIVRPVYAFENQHELRRAITTKSGASILLELESGCLVRIERAIEHSKGSVPAGTYRLSSLWSQGNAVLWDKSSKPTPPIGLAKLIEAGFCRIQ